MGMLFNTDETLLILKMLHERYGNNFNANRNDHVNLGDFTKDSHSVITGFGIDFPASNPSKRARWKKYLDHIDGLAVAQDPNYGGTSVAQRIRAGIVKFLNDANCVGIDFFALPANAVTVTFPPVTYIDNTNTKYYATIVINTILVDAII
jgi:hypothetical protein